MESRDRCVFCPIIYGAEEPKKETPAVTRHLLAFPADHPKVPGHMIVIPNFHEPKVSNLIQNPELTSEFETILRKLEDYLINKFSASGCLVYFNDGVESEQIISHAHLEVVPVYETGGGHAGN